jgi:hypothetical protein
VEAQLVLATLLESQAHRADSRRQPNTVGPSSRKTNARTQGLGRTPYVPGDTPNLEAGRAGTFPLNPSYKTIPPLDSLRHGYTLVYPYVPQTTPSLDSGRAFVLV